MNWAPDPISSFCRWLLARTVFRKLTWIRAAIVLLALFAALHLLGWSDDTAFISGTSTSPDPGNPIIRGVLYVAAYFLAVVVSPILLLGAGINVSLRLLLARQRVGASQHLAPGRSLTRSFDVEPRGLE